MVSASGNTARLRFLAASLPAPGTAAVSTRMSDAPALVRERQRSLLAEHASPADRASADTSELPTAALPAERSNHGRESRVPGRPQTRKPARAPRRLSLRGRQVGAGSDEQINPNQDTPKGSDGAWRHARRGQATDPDHGAATTRLPTPPESHSGAWTPGGHGQPARARSEPLEERECGLNR